MRNQLDVIAALCKIISDALEIIEDEQQRAALMAAYEAAIGEENE